ncbi:protein SIEVE ELEMENT OCCLUSION B-like [Macadamia integrifolia]|uniref:protein SIEVE ELEMENT OCCLUSION B-like n=1 Tax=Macadamia integrifolia TaxID=60698 RepID=UPI001C52D996|nr:protein SIEVE ELEMENT OCCLUSION B-like [Macadamia integrifolia]
MEPQQQQSENRNQFTTLEDNVTMKQILATHADNSFHRVDLNPHLQLIEEILHHSNTLKRINIDDLQISLHMESLDKKSQKVDFVGMLEALAYTIQKISCEILYSCSRGGDAHTTTMALFKSLSRFSWDAKVVLALAAFAITYGEFWLVEELYQAHPLAKSIVLVKQLPDIFEQSEKLRPRFEALWSLIKAMLDMTKSIVQFHELPPQYISPDQPPMSAAIAQIPTAVYLTIKGVVTCASQVIGLFGLDQESIPSTTEGDELSSLAQEINNIHEHLTKQLNICNQHIDEKKQLEAYNTLVQLFATTHIDNQKILRALINYTNDDLTPLLHYDTKKPVGVEVMRRCKGTLLLISDLDISQEEFVIVNQLIPRKKGLWLPVVDRSLLWTEARQKDVDRLQSNVRFYSVRHPSLIHPAVIKYIKEIWHFNKKPVVVVLDYHGSVLSLNNLPMMWIWGWRGWPSTRMTEEILWRRMTWGLKLLVQYGFENLHEGTDENLINWMEEKRFICLYGGEDIDWIRKFTTTIKEMAKKAGIPLEMMYMG